MRIVRSFSVDSGGVHAAARSLRWLLWSALLLVTAGGALAQTSPARPPYGGFEFSAATYTVGETDGAALITITRSNVLGKLAVDLVFDRGTATNNEASTPSPTNTLVFSNLQASLVFSIALRDNTTTNSAAAVEANLSLVNPRPGDGEDPSIVPVLGGRKTAKLRIVDNDKLLQFNIDRTYYTLPEGDTITVRVVLAQPPGEESQNVAVDYEVRVDDSTPLRAGSDYATDDEDFLIQAGTLEFGANDLFQEIQIVTTNDTLIEFNEDFHIILTEARGVLVQEAEEPATTGGATAGGGLRAAAIIPVPTTSGTTSGNTGGIDEDLDGQAADGGTTAGGEGEAEAVELPYALGPINKSTVTILFNGRETHPQPAGSVDQTYNPDNDSRTTPPLNPNPGANGTVYSVATTHDGRTVIGGDFVAYNATERNRIARLKADGTLDETFNPIGGANDFVTAVAVYTGSVNRGKVLIAGGFTAVNGLQRNSIARLNPDGSLDASFNPGSGANGPVYALALQRDGGVLIGGDFTAIDGIPRNRIARLTETGALDLVFDPGTGADATVYALVAQPVPSFTNSFRSIQVEPGPTNLFLQTLAPSGHISILYNFGNQTNTLQVFDDTGVIFNTGLTNNEVTITNTDGTTFTTNIAIRAEFDFFAAQSVVRFLINAATNDTTNWVINFEVQPDRNLAIFAGGDFRDIDGVPHGGVARFDDNGVVDESFAAGAGLGADSTVRAMAQQRNGRLILGGMFQSFNSIESPGLARLQTNGVLDTAFAIGSGANDSVFALATQPDDRILVAGAFTAINETRRIFVTRLLPGGPVDTSFMDPAYNEFAGFPQQAGLAPQGFATSVAVDRGTNSSQPKSDVIVGGVFRRVGGGGDRAGFRARANLARLVGGQTPGPGNIQFASAVFGADENGGVLVGSLTRTNGSLGQASALAATLDSVALAGQDYTAKTQAVTWTSRNAAGSTAPLPFSVTVSDDEIIEGTEDFVLQLSLPGGTVVLGGQYIPTGVAFGTNIQARANIIENDVTPSTFLFRKGEFDFNENDGTVTIDVARTGNSSIPASVGYSIRPGTGANAATDGVDFVSGSGQLQFSGGQTNKTFTVRLRDDASVEQDETVLLALANPSPGGVLGKSNVVATLTIIDNDYAPGRVSLSATNYNVDEGKTATVTVRRTGGNVGVIQVQYTTVDETAAVPFDYLQTSGTLIWNDLDSSERTIAVPISNDGLVEGGERLRIRLFNPSPAEALGVRTNSTVTILDDDALGAFAFNAGEYLADEKGGSISVTVVRTGGSADLASVKYATITNGTAVLGQDYEAASGVLNFGVGELSKTFTVRLLDDTAADGERTFGLELSDPQPAGALLGAIVQATVAIVDNETFNIPAGSVEADFATGAGANDAVHSVVIQSDGKIVIGGEFTQVQQQNRARIARLNADGTLDLRFAADTVIDNSVRTIALQSDGRLVLGGAFTAIDGIPQNHVARLGSSGLRDNTFNVGAGADNLVFAAQEVMVDGAPKILLGGGFSVYNAVTRRGIARVNLDGRTDLSFNPGTGVNGPVYAIAAQSDGRVLIGGEFSIVNDIPRNNIARLNPDGSVDETFNPGLGADAPVRAIALQFDQKILIGGLFNSVSSVGRAHVARLNVDGTLDESFDPPGGADGAVYALAVQRDGRIVVGGDFLAMNGLPTGRIARLNADGSTDTTVNFGSGANSFINVVAVQQDRKLVLGGGFTAFDGVPRGRIARIYGGSIEGSGEIVFESAVFTVNEANTNAVVTVRRIEGLSGTVSADYLTRPGTALPNVDYINVAGNLQFGPGENLRTFVVPLINDNFPEDIESVSLFLTNALGGPLLNRQPIATLRIVSDDSLISFTDATFSVNESAAGGRATVFVKREGETATAVSVTYFASGRTATDGLDFQSVSGSINFEPGESLKFFTVPILDDTEVEDNESIDLQLFSESPDAQIGRAVSTLTILDNDFAPGVISVLASNGASESSGAMTISVVRRSGRTGTVTVNFAVIGSTATPGEDFVPQAGSLTFLEGEITKTIVIALRDDSRIEGNEFISVVLSNPTGGAILGTANVSVPIVDDDFGPGSFDPTFQVGSGGPGGVRSMILHGDGRITVAGGFPFFGDFGLPRVARLNPNGSIDSTFFTGGGPDAIVYDVSLHPDGRLAFGGAFQQFDGIFRPYVGRYSSNGVADVNFNLTAGENAPVLAVAAQPDGKIIVGGQFTVPTRGLLRLNGNGSLDVSFDPDGGTDGVVQRLRLQPDGKVLVGGNFTRLGRMAVRSLGRLLPNGLIDSNFRIGAGVVGTVYAISVAPDGKILIGGDFTSVAGAGRGRIARLNEDGTVDLSFVPVAAPNGPVYDIVSHVGKIYIVGDFTSVGSVPRVNIARYNSDGSLDTTFDSGVGPDGPAYAVAVQRDGQILVAGEFTRLNGFLSPGIGRLNGDQPALPEEITIDSIRVQAGSFVLTYTSEAGRTYFVQGSTDFRAWQTVDTKVGTGGSLEFRETASAPYRFYRISTQ